jgi:hypothetical protein
MTYLRWNAVRFALEGNWTDMIDENAVYYRPNSDLEKDFIKQFDLTHLLSNMDTCRVYIISPHVQGQSYWNPTSFEQFLTDGQVDPRIVARNQTGQCTVALAVIREAWIEPRIIDLIGQFIQRNGIRREYFYYITNSGKDHTGIGINHYHMNFFMPRNYRQFYEGTSLPTAYVVEPKQRRFLCFNYALHAHRVWFYIMLHDQGVLENSYWSMPLHWKEYEFMQRVEFLKQAPIGRQVQEALGISQEQIASAGRLLPLTADPDYSRTHQDSNPHAPQLYADSLVSVITETHFFENTLHLTEKTFKPITFLHPFIMVSTAGSLAYLKGLGFKTFDSIWDESYDQEQDPVQRLIKIRDLIMTINRLSQDQLLELQHKIKPIVEHNYQNLLKVRSLHSQQFINDFLVLPQ